MDRPALGDDVATLSPIVRGYERNANGDALVLHPNTKRSKLAYGGASGYWPFDNYNGIDPKYAERGTLVHELTEALDLGEPPKYRPVDGIDETLWGSIGDAWRAFRDRWNFSPHRLADGRTCVEVHGVSDELRVATLIDRIDVLNSPIGHLPAGALVVADIKTSSTPIKSAYGVQLAVCTRLAAYDPDTGDRGDWNGELRRDVAFVYHLPLTKIIAGDAPVEWNLWMVTL